MARLPPRLTRSAVIHGQGERVDIGDLGRGQQPIRAQHAWGQQAEAIVPEAMARQIWNWCCGRSVRS